MIRDILLPLGGSRGDAAALEHAIALATQADAHLAVLVVVPLFVPPAFEWGIVPGDVYGQVHDQARQRAKASADTMRQRLESSGVRFDVRIEESLVLGVPRVAALHARHADISVVASAGTGEGAAVADGIFLELLQDSGRPVLAVPRGAAVAVPPGHAMVAWQPTREATRALHDALPLLRMAKTVDVLMIDPVVDEASHGEEPGADIATHLARHGVDVRVKAVPSLGEPTEIALLRHAVQSGADLVVAGGYSHSHWREALFGGVTRTLLESSPMPVLFSR